MSNTITQEMATQAVDDVVAKLALALDKKFEELFYF